MIQAPVVEKLEMGEEQIYPFYVQKGLACKRFETCKILAGYETAN